MTKKRKFTFEPFFSPSFDHIGARILDFLDIQALQNCKLVCKQWLQFITNSRFSWLKELEYHKKKFREDEKLIQLWNALQMKDKALQNLQKLSLFIREFKTEIKYLPCNSSNAHHRKSYDFSCDFEDLKILFIHGKLLRLEYCLPMLDLKELMPKIGSKKDNPLLIASRNGNTDVFKLLSSTMQSWNAFRLKKVCSMYLKCLENAIWENHEVVALLILKDQRIKLPKPKRMAELQSYAAYKGKLELFKLIAQRTGEINPKDKSRSTPLHSACR